MRRIFLSLAGLPLLLWGVGLLYLARLEGWGAWAAAAPVLLPVLALSTGLGLLGVALIWRAWRRAQPLGALAAATAVASVVAVYYAVRGVR
ncbi:MAG TPA: hypothetical protein VHQ45_12335 [Gemmatimonadaceae bacterium]|nr:hypothetical protein [Gemmatimonadaceae bacterium]